MNLLPSFLKHQLPGAQKGEAISKSIITYFDNEKTFVIGLGQFDGIITEQVKENLTKRLELSEKKVYFFSLIKNKKMFQMLCDRIAWGSYVWIASEPEHTIHFDNQPKLNPSYL